MAAKGPKKGKRGGKEPEAVLPLTPAMFNILVVLRNEKLHGYEIMQRIRERSGGRTIMGPSSLYGALKRMLVNGMVEEVDERPSMESDDERRRYYRITEFGQKVAAAEAERLGALVQQWRGDDRSWKPAPEGA